MPNMVIMFFHMNLCTSTATIETTTSASTNLAKLSTSTIKHLCWPVTLGNGLRISKPQSANGWGYYRCQWGGGFSFNRWNLLALVTLAHQGLGLPSWGWPVVAHLKGHNNKCSFAYMQTIDPYCLFLVSFLPPQVLHIWPGMAIGPLIEIPSYRMNHSTLFLMYSTSLRSKSRVSSIMYDEIGSIHVEVMSTYKISCSSTILSSNVFHWILLGLPSAN